MDKVTVVTVCYNAEKEIAETLKSVFEQNYQDIEYLIIDGYSSDKTLTIVSQYKKDYSLKENVSVRVVSEKDNGIYDAMNKGARLASGEWILFMNAGDTFHTCDVVSKIFNGRDYSGIDAVYGDTVRVRGDHHKFVEGKPLEDIRTGFPLPFCHQSIFVRTRHLKELEFDARYKQAGDYHFFARMYLKNVRFEHVPVIVSDYKMGGISETNTVFHLKEKIQIREELDLERYSFVRKNYLITRLFFRQLLKRFLPSPIVEKIRRA